MENLLVSACLMGAECKYSGGSNKLPEELLKRLRARYRLIPVCPETAGGLPTPRDPSERIGRRVMSCRGRDVTREYVSGAEMALRIAEKYACEKALLKQGSPSCGSRRIYDGTFSNHLINGSGVAAEMLTAAGVLVCGEDEAEILL